MSNIISRALAAVALAGAATLAVAGPAYADHGQPLTEEYCAQYPDHEGCEVVETQEGSEADAEEAFTICDPDALVPGTLCRIVLDETDFAPGTEVEVLLERRGAAPLFLGVATVGPNGRLVLDFRVPQAGAGSALISITGFHADGHVLQLTLPVTLAAGDGGGDGEGDGGGLPVTGAQIGIASLAGATALGAGTLLVLAGRKRKAVVTA